MNHMEPQYVFTPIDRNTWPMAQAFYYYTEIAPTSYTINVKMDVTVLRRVLKDRGFKFFPAYLYLVTRVICQQEHLRVGLQGEVLGHWNTLVPAYPQFHEDDKTTSLLWTEYTACFRDFHEQYLNDTRLYGGGHGILSAKGMPPANTYVISCIPWFTYESFSLHNHGLKNYYFPSFEAGGFTEVSGRIWMPLSVTVHHATTDGYHLKVFFETLQRLMDRPDLWM